MRQVLAIVSAALLAALGAVVLGEYPLEGTTALVGFPLYGIAVAELALAIGRRLAPLTLAAVAVLVGAGLSWALWISFGHFRNDVRPPALSWAMAAVAVVAALTWGWSGRRRHRAGDTGGARSEGPLGAGDARSEGPLGAGDARSEGPLGPRTQTDPTEEVQT